jgi:hypothetical protein
MIPKKYTVYYAVLCLLILKLQNTFVTLLLFNVSGNPETPQKMGKPGIYLRSVLLMDVDLD